MLFNSLAFVVFFVVFYYGYLRAGRSLRAQNALLLVGSYVFYGWWDWRFLSLIALSTVIDFTVARAMRRRTDPRARKALLWVSVGANLGILGFFKYFNFFADSAVDVAAALGMSLDPVTLDVILPVGISFYTFQTLSYSIDVYRGRLEPTDDLLAFAVFVSFFPQLVAGPIERARAFLPQVIRPRTITPGQIESGLFLIVWGFFKKIVIADNAAVIANAVFNDYAQYEGADLLIGALAFMLQIYGDFSGYSDIARGLSRLMGFELMVNFRLPYLARTPSEFWLRWHISLSSWLRDYLYISLGGNRNGTWKTYRNLMLTMLLGGLWHGAAWNFVLWGAFHGAILVIYRVAGITHQAVSGGRGMGRVARNVGLWAVMFALTLYGWILFRAETFDQIVHFTTHIGFSVAETTAEQTATWAWDLLFFATPLVLMQIWQAWTDDLLVPAKSNLVVRCTLYALLICAMMVFNAEEAQEFIYFQF